MTKSEIIKSLNLQIRRIREVEIRGSVSLCDSGKLEVAACALQDIVCEIENIGNWVQDEA